jgi:putative restriction endonuclease
VVGYSSAAALFEALRRVRVLLAKGPAQLEARWRAKLATITSTEKEAVVRQRVGQALFRDALLDYWGGRCAVTGLDVLELLRASHAKPWKSATDAERLDVHNGLLLAAHLDALFDQGFLTFDDSGEGRLSPQLNVPALQILGLSDRPVKLARVTPGHALYLAYHRAHVFRPA